MTTEKELVAALSMTGPIRELVNLLVRIDQSLTGKCDQTVWRNVRQQYGKLDDIFFGEPYYLSDGGLSRLVFNSEAKNATTCAFVTTNSTDRVKWLWEYETSFRVQLFRVMATLKEKMEA